MEINNIITNQSPTLDLEEPVQSYSLIDRISSLFYRFFVTILVILLIHTKIMHSSITLT